MTSLEKTILKKVLYFWAVYLLSLVAFTHRSFSSGGEMKNLMDQSFYCSVCQSVPERVSWGFLANNRGLEAKATCHGSKETKIIEMEVVRNSKGMITFFQREAKPKC